MIFDEETFQLFDKAWAQQEHQALGPCLEMLVEAACKKIVLPQVRDPKKARDWIWDALATSYQAARSKQLSAATFVQLFESSLRGWKQPGKRPVPGLIKKKLADEARERRRTAGGDALDAVTAGETPKEFSVDEIEEIRRSIPGNIDVVKRQTLEAILDYIEKHDREADLGYRPQRWVVAPTVLDFVRAHMSIKRHGAVVNRLRSPGVYESLEECGLSVFRKLEVSPRQLSDSVNKLEQKVGELGDDRTSREMVKVLIEWSEKKLGEANGKSVVLEAPVSMKKSGFRLHKQVSHFLEESMGVSQNTARKRFDRVQPYLKKLMRKVSA